MNEIYNLRSIAFNIGLLEMRGDTCWVEGYDFGEVIILWEGETPEECASILIESKDGSTPDTYYLEKDIDLLIERLTELGLWVEA